MKLGQRRAERRATRQTAKETRREGRMAMKQMRKGFRMEKLAIKTPGRDARRLAIAELATAPIAEGLGAGLGAIGEGFGAKLAGPGGMPGRDDQGNQTLSQRELMPEVDPNAQRDGTKKPNIMIIAVIAVVALMMFKKKGR